LAKVLRNITPKPNKLIKIEAGFLLQIKTSEAAASDVYLEEEKFYPLTI